MSSILLEPLNYGAAPNDETGDPLRVSFQKIQTNFNRLNQGKATNIVTVSQASHGFQPLTALYRSGTGYQKAISNDRNTLGVMVVVATPDANTFDIAVCGIVNGLSGLLPGQYYYVSDTAPGVLTTLEPVTQTHYSNPLLLALEGDTAIVLPFRPKEI